VNAAGIPVHDIYLDGIPISAHRHFVPLTLRPACHPCGRSVTQSNRLRRRKGLLAVGRIGLTLLILLNQAVAMARSRGRECTGCGWMLRMASEYAGSRLLDACKAMTRRRARMAFVGPTNLKALLTRLPLFAVELEGRYLEIVGAGGRLSAGRENARATHDSILEPVLHSPLDASSFSRRRGEEFVRRRLCKREWGARLPTLHSTARHNTAAAGRPPPYLLFGKYS
jgi:hypothetical protein